MEKLQVIKNWTVEKGLGMRLHTHTHTHTQCHCSGAQETGDSGVQVSGRRHGTHTFGERPRLCSPAKGRTSELVKGDKFGSLSVRLSILSICHSSDCLDHLYLAVVCLLVCSSVCLSTCLSLFICLSVYLSVSVHLFCLSACLSLFICFVCLFVSGAQWDPATPKGGRGGTPAREEGWEGESKGGVWGGHQL